MAYNAKNGTVAIEGAAMDYAAFGKGKKYLIMLPGLGDGLRTVKGMAATLSNMYRIFARQYRVYMFSRRHPLPVGFTSRDMAADIKAAMDTLGIEKADVLGVSQGGTIAQYLAADHPEAVSRLVLAVTYAAPNQIINECVGSWIDLAGDCNYRGIFITTTERSYTERMLKKYRPLYPLLSRVAVPKSLERFTVMAQACLTHDAREVLGRITAPTLIIGGARDRIVGGDAVSELAELIPGSELYVYEKYGHALYEEAKDFNARVLGFLTGGEKQRLS